MAADNTTYYKNDGTGVYRDGHFAYFPTIEDLGWSRDGYTFVSWNTRADGTGESYAGGLQNPGPTETGYGVYYAIWEVDVPTYLDMEGLAHYDSLVKIIVNGKVDAGGKAGGIPYGSVDSTSTSTNFTATVEGLTKLYDGACMMLHNGVVSSANNFTVNVNGLGAKKCYNNLTNATQDTTIFDVAYTLMFVYSTALDSGNGGWWIYRGYDSDTGMILLEYGKSTWADFESAYDANRIVYCLAKVAYGYRLAFMAYRTSSDVEFQYYRTVEKKSATQQGDEVYIYKLNNESRWTTIVRQNYTKIAAGTGLTSTYAANTGTLTLTLPPATASTLGGVKVGTGLSIASDGTISLTDNGYVTQDNFKTVLDDAVRFAVIAADATSAALIGTIFGAAPGQMMPNDFINAYHVYLVINNRHYLSWMDGARLEVAPLNAKVDTQTEAITLYARGQSSMAYGVMGVDESWTITALPTDADGVSY